MPARFISAQAEITASMLSPGSAATKTSLPGRSSFGTASMDFRSREVTSQEYSLSNALRAGVEGLLSSITMETTIHPMGSCSLSRPRRPRKGRSVTLSGTPNPFPESRAELLPQRRGTARNCSLFGRSLAVL